VKHEAWAEDAAQLGVRLSGEQVTQLQRYEGLLQRIAVPRGMIAASDAARLWERHIRDGLRAVPEITDGSSVADLGSGAGLPGVPLAVALKSSRLALIEPRRPRAAFLEAAVDELGLGNVDVLQGRVEEVSGSFDVCVARAFSSPLGTWEAARHLLARGGILIYWAGERFDKAVLDAEGVRSRLSRRSALARTGPLVIMGPQ